MNWVNHPEEGTRNLLQNGRESRTRRQYFCVVRPGRDKNRAVMFVLKVAVRVFPVFFTRMDFPVVGNATLGMAPESQSVKVDLKRHVYGFSTLLRNNVFGVVFLCMHAAWIGPLWSKIGQAIISSLLSWSFS